MKKLLVPLLFTCLPLAALAQPELKGNPEELRQFLHPQEEVIVVQGRAEKKAYSDRAIISLVVTTEHKKLSAAIAANTRLRAQIAKALEAGGIAPGAIRNSKFSSSPQYGWFGDEPVSYKVNNRMAITIDDEAQLERIAQAADEHKNVELADTQFEHTRYKEFREQVLADAFDQVMNEKAFYEKTLGIELAPLGINESRADQQGSRGAQALNRINISQKYVEKALKSAPRGALYGDVGSGDSSFDEVVYAATVSVKFRIVR